MVIKLTEEERKHIKKRLRQGKKVELMYRILRIFPINRKKIVFTTFEGNGGYCCNPRYIAEEILNRKLDLELVWLVNDMSKKFPKGIRKVKNTFWNRAYHLSTAKIWIDNTRKPLGTLKRKKQVYLQTWHGAIEFKAVGKYRGKAFPKIAEVISRKDSEQIDYLISNSKWYTKHVPKMLVYNGEIIKTGSPRCDVLINKRDEKRKEIRKRYQIPQDANIVLYAPTFRGGNQQGKREIYSETPTIDFKKLTQTLESKFGGKWYVLLRMHPQLSAIIDEMPLENKLGNMVDVSKADDMNELIAASDVYITDYSCAAFDALNIKMPIFLYADDFTEYVKERGEFMWDMRKLPFTLAESNEELVENIIQFDLSEYVEEVSNFLECHEVLEDGGASKRILKWIRN